MEESEPLTMDQLVQKLNRDLKQASATLKPHEVRFLVDNYYRTQDERIRTAAQERELADGKEPHEVISWFFNNSKLLEDQIKLALDYWTRHDYMGAWSRNICGIGPVLAAGLSAMIDIEKAPTVGHIWRFAGLDPTRLWVGKEGAKDLVKDMHEHDIDDTMIDKAACAVGLKPERLREMARIDPTSGATRAITKKTIEKSLSRLPYNQSLKTLCWKIGESFVKVSSNDRDIYGQVYIARKKLEVSRNDQGVFAVQAKESNVGKSTDAWKWYNACYPAGTMACWLALEDQGARMKYLEEVQLKAGEGVFMLPPAHIQSRSKRYATKLFLAHWHEIAYRHKYDKAPPLPYAIAFKGHAHKIEPPPRLEDIVKPKVAFM